MNNKLIEQAQITQKADRTSNIPRNDIDFTGNMSTHAIPYPIEISFTTCVTICSISCHILLSLFTIQK